MKLRKIKIDDEVYELAEVQISVIQKLGIIFQNLNLSDKN